MRIVNISIKHMKDLESFETAMPAVAFLTGANGAGKSSFIDVLCYTFGRRPEGGPKSVVHDPNMLHVGAEEGSCLIAFEDGSKLRCRVTSEGTKRERLSAGGRRWVEDARDIDRLGVALSYDPLSLGRLSAKERIGKILEMSPVVIDSADVANAIAPLGMPAPMTATLDTLQSLTDNIYRARTDRNAAVKVSEAHAAELERTLPPETEGGDWTGVATALRAEKDGLEKEIADYTEEARGTLRTIEKDEDVKFNEWWLEADRKQQEIIRGLEAQIVKIKEQYTEVRASKNSEKNNAVAEARQDLLKLVDAKKTELKPRIESLVAEIATAESNSRAEAVAEETRRNAAIAKRKAVEAKAQADAMTTALDALQAIREKAAGTMKIKGYTITSPRPGEPVDVCKKEDGGYVPFPSWNWAARLFYCLKVALQAHGECGLICIDDIGGLDPDNREGFIKTCRQYAEKLGVQFVIGEATRGVLAVKEEV